MSLDDEQPTCCGDAISLIWWHTPGSIVDRVDYDEPPPKLAGWGIWLPRDDRAIRVAFCPFCGKRLTEEGGR